MGFNEQYNRIFDLVKSDISKVSGDLLGEITLDEPLKSSLKKILSAPSKHIRALTAFLYLKAHNVEVSDSQILLQTAVELIHNASLIHDDIIDESSIRRGEKTLNQEFDNRLAVISGDYLLALALKKISTIGSFAITELFSGVMKTMCLGEINQYFSKYKNISIEDYILKSQYKTAVLFQASIEGAAILSGTLSRKTAADFSINFGTAFQIRDDLINFQTTQSDLKSGIFTAPVIFSTNLSAADAGIEKTRLLLNNYIDKSYDSIKNLNENSYKQALVELLELLKNE